MGFLARSFIFCKQFKLQTDSSLCNDCLSKMLKCFQARHTSKNLFFPMIFLTRSLRCHDKLSLSSVYGKVSATLNHFKKFLLRTDFVPSSVSFSKLGWKGTVPFLRLNFKANKMYSLRVLRPWNLEKSSLPFRVNRNF